MSQVIIYVRTSTEEQNPENQLKDCLSINKYGDFEVIEDRVSAWKEVDREGFEKLKKLIIAKKFEHIVVWDLDRIYRNRKKLIEFFELCKINKVKIHSYRQQWLEDIHQIPPPFDEIVHTLLLHIMGWLAEEESSKKSQRVKAAMRIKEEGVYSYTGKKWGRESISKLKKNKIRELRNKGQTLKEIASELGISIGAVHKYL